MNSVLVIGIGDETLGDDAIGPTVAQQLESYMPKEVSIKRLSGEALGLIAAWENASKAIVLDAVKTGASPGTIHRFEPLNSTPFPVSHAPSSHQFGIAEAVEMGRVLDRLPQTLVIFGVEAEGFERGDPMSPKVRAAVPILQRRVIEEIELGVKVNA